MSPQYAHKYAPKQIIVLEYKDTEVILRTERCDPVKICFIETPSVHVFKEGTWHQVNYYASLDQAWACALRLQGGYDGKGK